MQTSQQFGIDCEIAAARFYKAMGSEILAKNYRCRAGEIDLIVRHRGFLIFVEVRGRRRSRDDAFFSVDQRKRVKLIRAARWFLARNSASLPPGVTETRFDLALVDRNGVVEQICNAFFL